MSSVEPSVAEYQSLRSLLRGVLEEYLKGPAPEPVELITVDGELTDAHRRWLMLLDLCAAPEALRIGITKRSPDEESLIVLLRYFIRMGREVDHDRFDWTITYLFKRRLDHGEAQVDGSLGAEITAMFPDSPQPPLSDHARKIVEELTAALGQVTSFTTFDQLTESGLIDKGRDRKASFHEERYHPAVLAAVVKYNVVVGRTFRKLFDEAAGRSRDLAAKLAHSDYRSNAEPLRKLGKVSKADASVAAPVVHGPMLDPAKELGLDQGREAQKIRFTLRSLVAYFELPANQEQTVARIGNVACSLAEWEARALQTSYPESDTSFRAQFAESARLGAAILFRIAEESDHLRRKSGSEYLWKPHYDALVWLFAKARAHVEALEQLADITGKRGLPAKQQQLLNTAERLAQTVRKGSEELAGAPMR